MRRAAHLLLAVPCFAIAAHAEVHTFFVRLDGQQQVPPSATGASGFGHLVLDTTAHTLSFDLAYGGLVGTETMAHVHGFAAPGANAGILYTLPTGSPKIGSVVTTPADEASIVAGLAYVNVHTTTFPSGEIRGQIVRTTQFLFRATLDGAQEVPPLPSPGSGSGSFVLDTSAHTLRSFVTFQNLSGAETVAHMHGFAEPGAFAGPLYFLPLGNPKEHVAPIEDVWEPYFLAGLGYVNIHSTVYLNGELRGQLELEPAPIPYDVCAGDGTGSACPCGNTSALGADVGCLHSFGLGGRLRIEGIASLECDTLALAATDLPPTTAALFFQGTSAANGGMGTVFGDGLRCASGAVLRLGTLMTFGGAATLQTPGGVPLHVVGQVTAPGSRTYQTWYRNSAPFCTPSGFNLTNGATIAWTF